MYVYREERDPAVIYHAVAAYIPKPEREQTLQRLMVHTLRRLHRYLRRESLEADRILLGQVLQRVVVGVHADDQAEREPKRGISVRHCAAAAPHAPPIAPQKRGLPPLLEGAHPCRPGVPRLLRLGGDRWVGRWLGRGRWVGG